MMTNGSFQQLKKHLNMSYNDIEEISDKLKLKVLARNIKKLKDKFLKKSNTWNSLCL